MIYHDDIAACNEYAQDSAENLKRCALFVVATIQQQLETVPVILTGFVSEGGGSKYAWGFKSNSIEYLDANYCELYRDAMRAKDKPGKLLAVFLRVPGFGIVKAGFLAQIFANQTGCIDVHNVTLYGVPMSALRYTKKCKAKTLREKRAQYIDLCAGLGGSAELWSRWCDYVAAMRPNNWANGSEVSRFHVDVITGLETGAIIDLFTGIDIDPTFLQAA